MPRLPAAAQDLALRGDDEECSISSSICPGTSTELLDATSCCCCRLFSAGRPARKQARPVRWAEGGNAPPPGPCRGMPFAQAPPPRPKKVITSGQWPGQLGNTFSIRIRSAPPTCVGAEE